MGAVRPPEEAVLFIGSLFSQKEIFHKTCPVLKETFGDFLFVSPVMPWDFTSYYNEELGTPVYRSFVFFDSMYDPSLLSDAKLATNDLELSFSHEGKRQINLDPGYITLSKLVLASTKNYSHRIYLGKGIYGEITLSYRDGCFHPLQHTYNDYKDSRFLNIFENVRSLLKNMTKIVK